MAATLLALLITGLVIEGPSECPTPAEVAAAVRTLLPEELSGSDDRLRITPRGRALEVLLLDARGNRLVGRDLPPAPSCADQARRVAVMGAAWQGELSDEPLPPGPAVVASAPLEEAQRLWPAALTGRPNPAYLEMGFRLSYVSVGGTTIGFELGAGASWGRLGLEGSVWGELFRSYLRTVYDEESFSRFAAELGPTLLVRMENPGVQLRAQGVVSGLLVNHGAVLDPGAELAVRVLVGRPPVRGFIDATATLWPQFLAPVQAIPLSPIEVFFTLGMLLGGA